METTISLEMEQVQTMLERYAQRQTWNTQWEEHVERAYQQVVAYIQRENTPIQLVVESEEFAWREDTER